MVPIRMMAGGLIGALVLVGLLALSADPKHSTFSKTAAIRYTVTDLDVLPGDVVSQPSAVNDAGQVVGTSQNVTNPQAFQDRKSMRQRAFLWQNGKLSELEAPAGYADSDCLTINNKGEILGRIYTDSYENVGHAVIWLGGKLRILNIQSVSGEDTGSMNNQEDVGWNSYFSGQSAIFLSNGKKINPGTLQKGYRSGIGAIGDPQPGHTPEVVGSCGMLRPFCWVDGKISALPTPRSAWGSADAINDQGVIAGGYEFAHNGPIHPCIWQNGKLTDLAAYPSQDGRAEAINDRNQVVGFISASQLGDMRAFLGENGKLIHLDNCIPANSGWVLKEATGINNKGQIVGNGEYNDQDRGFLLTPAAH